MFRLTFTLLAALGVAMLVAGRDLSPAEQARLEAQNAPPARPGPPPLPPLQVINVASAAPAVSDKPEAGVRAARPKVVGQNPIMDQSVDQAVEMAISTDMLENGDGGQADTTLTASSDNVAADPPPQIQSPFMPPLFQTPQPASVDAADAPRVAEVAPDAVQPDGAGVVRFVNGNVVNVRQGPSTDYAVVGKVSFGEEAEALTDPGGDWVKIRAVDGTEGYIAGRFLQDIDPDG